MVSLKIAGASEVCRRDQIINLLQIHQLIVLFDKIRIHSKYVFQKMLALYCISFCAVQAMFAHNTIIAH